MKIGLVNLSKDPVLSNPDLFPMLANALEMQLYAHFAVAWQAEGVPVVAYDSLDKVPADTSPLIVFDTPDQAHALGWHSVDGTGKPFGRAFWQLIRDNGGTLMTGPMSLSVTLSHEALEMVGNPYVNFWADMPDGSQEALELCDRVEGDAYSIFVETRNLGALQGEATEWTVSVSNFLTPRAFRNGPGPYDYMRLLQSPWELRPGGYAIRRKDGKVENVWGHAYEDWRRKLKARSPRMLQRHGKLASDTQPEEPIAPTERAP